MAVKEILLLGNPVLRTPSARVRHFATPRLRRTVKDLSDTLADFRRRRGFGRGIAAPQIGVQERVIYLEEAGPLVNPRITRRSRQMMTLWDDCFSFPDLLVKVQRHLRVSVEYHDKTGRKRTLAAEGGLSELLQHEIDHLDGILAVDRALDPACIITRAAYDADPGTFRQQVDCVIQPTL
jgi:peptide deformylase